MKGNLQHGEPLAIILCLGRKIAVFCLEPVHSKSTSLQPHSSFGPGAIRAYGEH